MGRTLRCVLRHNGCGAYSESETGQAIPYFNRIFMAIDTIDLISPTPSRAKTADVFAIGRQTLDVAPRNFYACTMQKNANVLRFCSPKRPAIPHSLLFFSLFSLIYGANAFAFDVDRTASGAVVGVRRTSVQVFLQASAIQDLAFSKVETALRGAIDAWNDVPGAQVRLQYGGLVSQPPLFDVYVYFDSSFQIAGTELTAATIRDDASDGAIHRAEIALNNNRSSTLLRVHWAPLATGTSVDPNVDLIADLQGVLTHQLGHALGIAHSRRTAASMYFSGVSAQWRSLDLDDERAARFAYPDAKTASTFAPGGQCDACRFDADCVSTANCLAWPDGTAYCAQNCTKNDDCDIGYSCGDYNGGKACLPNDQHCRVESAQSGFGRPCAGNGACASGTYCALDGRSPYGYCTTNCNGSCGTLNAPCVTFGNGTAASQSLCVPFGAGNDGARCMVAADCASQNCMVSVTGGGFCATLCKSTCATGSACGPDGFCTPRCDAGGCPDGLLCNKTNLICGGPLPVGWPCASGVDCASRQCIAVAKGSFTRVCSQVCVVASDCPIGTGCSQMSAATMCVPFGLGGVGSPCLSNGACATKLMCDLGANRLAGGLSDIGSCRTICDPYGGSAECNGDWCAWVGSLSKSGGACRPADGGLAPGSVCGADKPCRSDLVCAGPADTDPTCRFDCDAATNLGCAPGQACAPLQQTAANLAKYPPMQAEPNSALHSAGRGVCSDNSVLIHLEVHTSAAPQGNFSATQVSLPQVFKVAGFVPPKAPAAASGGCAARPAQGGPPLLLIALAALGFCLRRVLP